MTAGEPEPTPKQLRRRRAASQRLPPLPDGRHDPLDPPRRKPRIVRVRVIGAHTTEFAGPGVIDAIKTLGIRCMYSRFGGAWQIPAQHTDDLMALLESRKFTIEPTL